MTEEIEYQNVHGSEEFRISVSEGCDDKRRRSKRDEQSNIPALAATVQKTNPSIGAIMVEWKCDNAQKSANE